jgi:hypothetical protein
LGHFLECSIPKQIKNIKNNHDVRVEDLLEYKKILQQSADQVNSQCMVAVRPDSFEENHLGITRPDSGAELPTSLSVKYLKPIISFNRIN